MAVSSLKRSLAACFLAGLAGAAMAGEVTVSAAASLPNAFKDIAQGYESAHPGSKVLLNFGASGALLQQMAKGAPVDVFASADQETMDAAQQQGLVRAADRADFVRNALVVIAPVDAKAPPAALKDLAAPGVARVALALPASVPVGRYAKHALEAAGLPVLENPSHIVPVMVRDAEKCKAASDLLMERHGIYIQPINYPTVARGHERLRITPTPPHSDALIADLVDALVDVWKTLELPFVEPKNEAGAGVDCAYPDLRKAAE